MSRHTERDDQPGCEGCIFGREAKGPADSSESTERSDHPNLYKIPCSARESHFKHHPLTQCPTPSQHGYCEHELC
jgi:hypothetical protein